MKNGPKTCFSRLNTYQIWQKSIPKLYTSTW